MKVVRQSRDSFICQYWIRQLERMQTTECCFEIRTRHGGWCLDSFVMAQDQSKTLLNCRKLHPLGRWYRVTAVYDGKILKNYVGRELQGEGEVHLAPQGAGHSSVGVRINLQDYFKGAIFEARFTDRALAAEDFLKMPEETAGK
jgi:hypothetical protein